MKKQFILISVALGAIAFTTGTLALTQNFKDVPTHHFAYEAILEGKESGLFKGYNDGTFKPDKNLSRGEMAVLLERNNQIMEKEMKQMFGQGSSVSAAAPSAPVVKAQELTYKSSKYGFSLTFPESWKGYTTSYRSLDFGTSGKADSIDFGLPAQQGMFNISMHTQAQWDSIQKEEGPKPSYLGKGNGYVFGYSGAQYAANSEMEKRLAEAETIVKRFTVSIPRRD